MQRDEHGVAYCQDCDRTVQGIPQDVVAEVERDRAAYGTGPRIER